jgi:hypothetical protein
MYKVLSEFTLRLGSVKMKVLIDFNFLLECFLIVLKFNYLSLDKDQSSHIRFKKMKKVAD